MAPKSQLCACSFQDSLWQKNWALEQIREFPDTFGYVWTAENDSNTLRVDAKIFVSAKKCLRKKKFPNTCGHSLNQQSNQLEFHCGKGAVVGRLLGKARSQRKVSYPKNHRKIYPHPRGAKYFANWNRRADQCQAADLCVWWRGIDLVSLNAIGSDLWSKSYYNSEQSTFRNH